MERAHKAHPDVQTAPEALQWAISAYEQLYHFEEGLTPSDREARNRRERGQTLGYAPTLGVCAPVLPGCSADGPNHSPEPPWEPDTLSTPTPPPSSPRSPPSGPAVAVAEAEAKAGAEAEAEKSATAAEPEAGAEAEAEAEGNATVAEAEPETEAEPEAEAEVGAEPEAEGGAEGGAEGEAEGNATLAEAEAEAEPEAEAEAEGEINVTATGPPAAPPAEPVEGEPEMGAEVEAEPVSQAGPGADVEPDVEPEAWPEPMVSVLEAAGPNSLPDACKRFLLHDEARRTTPRNKSCEAVRRQRSARDWAYLHGSHNRFIGPLFVVQRRRKEVACPTVGGEASAVHALFPQCYGTDTDEEETRPCAPAHHFYQFHNPALGGYVLPVDLGLFRVMKDTGLCFLQLAAAEGWADRATRDLSVSFATFNGQLSRWGAIEVRLRSAEALVPRRTSPPRATPSRPTLAPPGRSAHGTLRSRRCACCCCW